MVISAASCVVLCASSAEVGTGGMAAAAFRHWAKKLMECFTVCGRKETKVQVRHDKEWLCGRCLRMASWLGFGCRYDNERGPRGSSEHVPKRHCRRFRAKIVVGRSLLRQKISGYPREHG